MFNNPFKRKTCDKCGKVYEVEALNCPQCDDVNLEADIGRKHKNIYITSSLRELLCFGIGWLGLQFVSLILSLIAIVIANSKYPNDIEGYNSFISSNSLLMTLNSLSYIMIFFAFLIFIGKEIKPLLSSFKKGKNILFGFLAGIGLILVSILWNMFAQVIMPSSTVNENEKVVEEMIVSFPLVSVIVFGVIGPICEELTYRIGLFTFLRKINRVFAFAISTLIFGLIHFDWQSVLTFIQEGTIEPFLNELINLPSYLAAGFILGITYEQFGLAGSVTAHLTNNLASFALTFLAKYLEK